MKLKRHGKKLKVECNSKLVQLYNFSHPSTRPNSIQKTGMAKRECEWMKWDRNREWKRNEEKTQQRPKKTARQGGGGGGESRREQNNKEWKRKKYYYTFAFKLDSNFELEPYDFHFDSPYTLTLRCYTIWCKVRFLFTTICRIVRPVPYIQLNANEFHWKWLKS